MLISERLSRRVNKNTLEKLTKTAKYRNPLARGFSWQPSVWLASNSLIDIHIVSP